MSNAGWNKPSEQSNGPMHKNRVPVIISVLALLIMIAVVGVVILKPQGKADEKSTDTSPKNSTIAEAPHASSPKQEASKPVQKKYSEMSREEKLKWYEDRYGDNIPESLKPTVYFLKHPPTVNFKPLPRREDIFQHKSERNVAAILLLEPGSFILQRSTYGEEFDHDFKKALESPTLITKDDTEEQRELKKAVSETMADLAAQMREGKKPSDILTQAMDSAYELGKYKRNIEEMLHEISMDPSKTDADVEDFTTAANKLLKSKGASELTMPDLVRRQVRLKVRARQAEERARAESQKNAAADIIGKE